MFDIILFLGVFGSFAFGYFVIQHLDVIFDEKQKVYNKAGQSEMIVLNTVKDEEILQEIHRFRKNHENIQIMLCDKKMLSHVNFK